jgi:RNA polymerase sigma-70 factor, ECF subfamily
VWDFENIYRAHVDAVFRYALSLAGSRSLAEDFTSDAFLALLRHRDAVEEARLPAWLFTVVKNRLVDHQRRKSTERQYLDWLLKAGQDTPGLAALDAGLLEHKALKPVHRVCLALRYVHGMTRFEIAENTGLSETQVKGHLQYALEILRKELAKDSSGYRTEPALE